MCKTNNTSSKDVIDYLKELDVEVSNHMSTISDDTKGKLDKKFVSQPKKNEKVYNKQP
ncbi:hypothetical protein CV093_09855 [Oceanobacillus sp. 143]|nr:hypothetical protein CV093_09855 [Oceanobacillus sp. 143]